uniref:Uncharacterized protein n=1 Tax=Leersia perrieri TaxID=77586 RepID=A0A0D9XFA4_9ORYZ
MKGQKPFSPVPKFPISPATAAAGDLDVLEDDDRWTVVAAVSSELRPHWVGSFQGSALRR